MLLLASPAAAQDATMNGIVMDESKAVLPGANVVATSRSTGRVFDAVTNERGEYRLAGMPPGRYDRRVSSRGFATVVLSDIELLVGQNATIPYTLKLATLDETVTVTGESPLDRSPDRARGRATSIAARWSNCRSRAATGCSCR